MNQSTSNPLHAGATQADEVRDLIDEMDRIADELSRWADDPDAPERLRAEARDLLGEMVTHRAELVRLQAKMKRVVDVE